MPARLLPVSRLLLLFWLFGLPISSAALEVAVPPMAGMVNALKRIPYPFVALERLEIVSVIPVDVGNDEVAHLVELYFPDDGNNFSRVLALYRGKLKQARLLNYKRVQQVHYGRQYITLSSYESGAGSEHERIAFVKFEGWKLAVLHEVENSSTRFSYAPGESENCSDDWAVYQYLPHASPTEVVLYEHSDRCGSKRVVTVSAKRLRLTSDKLVEIESGSFRR